MSEDNAAVDTSCCASCGIAEVDEVKLKECATCYLVRYCSEECQRDHKSSHKEDCKKRAAELRDELLFKQPESTHRGDCPICCLPLSLHPEKSAMMVCCSKFICDGCDLANKIREMEERRHPKCPFCRYPIPDTDEEGDKRIMKRIEVNDPVAITQWGLEQHIKGNYSTAFEYSTRAAELGDAVAHCHLADLYHNGHGVEKDKGKKMYHHQSSNSPIDLISYASDNQE
eukprot:scaffold14126_cov73-Skeletonema_marinoi.AAC.1